VEIYNNIRDGETASVYVFFDGNNERLAVQIYERESIAISGRENIKLKRDITGYYKEGYEEKGIIWKDPKNKSNFIYSVSVANLNFDSLTKKENKYSKSDVINVANSIIDNYQLEYN
jgi:hypothetical protein